MEKECNEGDSYLPQLLVMLDRVNQEQNELDAGKLTYMEWAHRGGKRFARFS
jgi:hypothetical protein